MLREDQKDPDHPGSHGSQHGEYHGHGGMTHAPERSREEIHEAAEEIGQRRKGQNLHTASHDFLVIRINFQNLRAKAIERAADHQRHARRQDHAVDKHPIHPLPFSHAVILAREAHAGLGDGVHRRIEKAQQVVGRRVTRHSDGAEGVYRGLEQHIGKIDDRTLDSRRNSDLKDLL